MKIKSRKQRTDIKKCSFVNRAIQLWNTTTCRCFRDSPVNQTILGKGQESDKPGEVKVLWKSSTNAVK
jgi:hypothetical protein